MMTMIIRSKDKNVKIMFTYIVPQSVYAISSALCVTDRARRSAQAAAQARTHGLWPAATQSAIFNGLHHRNPWTTTDPGGMED